MALTDNLVSYWKLDETSGNADDAVTTNDLTNVNTATYAAAVINNGANLVAASTQYLAKTTPVSVPGAQATGDIISLNGWVKMASQPGSAGVAGAWKLLTLWDGATGEYRSWTADYFKDAADATFLRLITSHNGSNANVASVSQTLSNATWYMVTFTKTGTAWEMFVNGSSIGSGTFANSALFNTAQNAKLILGSQDNGTGELLNGMLDEWGVWDKVLSGTEITQLYNGGAGFAYPFASATVFPKPTLLTMGVG